MHDLQALGEALVALDPARLAALDLPERLADAIAQARTITRHEGRRRQMQYVGPADARRRPGAAAGRAGRPRSAGGGRPGGRFAALERWRERVLEGADGLAEFVAAFPAADAAALGRLVADTRNERLRGGPPHKYRALFRELKRIVDAAGPTGA